MIIRKIERRIKPTAANLRSLTPTLNLSSGIESITKDVTGSPVIERGNVV